MVTEVQAGPYTIRGISVAGVYTSLQIPQLHVVLDAGVPMRSFASTDRLFLSHTHPDHASAVPSLLGIRNLVGKSTPLSIYLPIEAAEPLDDALRTMARLHHTEFAYELIPLEPGDEHALGRGLFARAFRTHHSAPSLGYHFLRKVTRVKPEFRHLPGEEIGRLRMTGHSEIFEHTEHLELAYATDTLADALDTSPESLHARVLIFEATYLDDRRSIEDARLRKHTHVDELFARADRITSEALVLMHFSQIYGPNEVRRVLEARTPDALRGRVIPFAPEGTDWFG